MNTTGDQHTRNPRSIGARNVVMKRVTDMHHSFPVDAQPTDASIEMGDLRLSKVNAIASKLLVVCRYRSYPWGEFKVGKLPNCSHLPGMCAVEPSATFTTKSGFAQTIGSLFSAQLSRIGASSVRLPSFMKLPKDTSRPSC